LTDAVRLCEKYSFELTLETSDTISMSKGYRVHRLTWLPPRLLMLTLGYHWWEGTVLLLGATRGPVCLSACPSSLYFICRENNVKTILKMADYQRCQMAHRAGQSL